MFTSLIKWKKFLKFDAGANDAKGTENCGNSLKEKLTSQLCRGNRACVRSRFLRSESADEDGLTSRLPKIVMVPQLQVIDESAKVPKNIQRQVPMIQEMQQDQTTDKVEVQKDHKCKARCKAPREREEGAERDSR